MQPGNGLDKDNVTSFDMRKNIVDHQGPLTTPYQCEINASRRNQAKIASDLLAIGGANSFPLAKGQVFDQVVEDCMQSDFERQFGFLSRNQRDLQRPSRCRVETTKWHET